MRIIVYKKSDQNNALGFVFARGTVFTSHGAASNNYSAVNAFGGAMAVDMLAGGGLQTTVAIGRRTAVNAVLFIGIVLVEPVKAFGAAGTEFT
jgi:hypothetical protein